MNNPNENTPHDPGSPQPPQGDGFTHQQAQPPSPTQPETPAGGTASPPQPGHAQHVPPTQPGFQPTHQTPHATAAKKSSGGARIFLLAFLGAALACVIAFAGFGIYNAVTGSGSQTVIGSSGSTINASDTDQTLPEAVAQKCLPSVVNIDVYTSQGPGIYSNSNSLSESALGSGVILSDDGYILTNYHVIAGAQALEVTIGDETKQADVVGTDETDDIAVIKARDVSGLTPIDVGSSSDLVVGEWVMTIGSPYGLEQSVATGIVSATSRSQIVAGSNGGSSTVYTNMIQTDAAINPGNSGGALVDQNGKLIGINTLIASSTDSYSGVGFAIPVDYAVGIAQQLIEGKTPSHAQLGVGLTTVNSAIAKRYGLPVDQGAYITEVYAGTGAANAGLQVGDIVTKFDGQDVASADDLMVDIRTKSPGDQVTLTINRNGQSMDVQVTLGSDSDTTGAAAQQGFGRSPSGTQSSLLDAA